MALTRTKKEEVLAHLKALITDANSVGFTTNIGLTVEDVTALRVQLREVDATFTLSKKTLIKKAFKDVYDVELDDANLPNQIAMVISNEDAVAGLGKVNDFMKKKSPWFEKMEWTMSYFEWAVQGKEETIEIAGMPSRETLLGRLVGSMQSPLSGLARFFDAAAKELEEKGKDTLGNLDAPAKEEVKTEEPKTEETPEVKEESNEADDLTKVEWIGPKTSEALVAGWVKTFADLSKKTPEEVSEIIAEVKGSHITDTWPKQAEMAAEGKWDELKKWQDELDGGKPAA